MPAIENGTYGDTIINLNKFDFLPVLRISN